MDEEAKRLEPVIQKASLQKLESGESILVEKRTDAPKSALKPNSTNEEQKIEKNSEETKKVAFDLKGKPLNNRI